MPLRKHWRAYAAAALIGAMVMGVQALVFSAPGFSFLAAVGMGAAIGFCFLLFALGVEGL